jgi:hypothetical protein
MSARPLGRWAGRITLTTCLLIAVAGEAAALDLGHCDTPEKLSAMLKAEGHKIVATMDVFGYHVDDENWGHVASLVTARPDLTRWYILKGDKPLGTKSSRMCIAGKGKNLQINDHRRAGTPTVTRYRFDRERAMKGCEKVRQNFVKGARCNEHYAAVAGLGKEFGERIALQGQDDRGLLMTMIADPNSNSTEYEGDRDYRMLVTTTDGAAGIAASGVRFAFSQWVISVLDKRK